MATGTRQKILDNALDLFNERGFVNITLRDIANGVGISPGNLAYHFRNKDLIIREIYDRMASEAIEMVAGIQMEPTFENIDQQFQPFYAFQQKYRFFYLDTLEICRAYHEIEKVHQQNVKNLIASIRAILAYSVERGNMQPERFSGIYDQLAMNCWAHLNFWILQEKIQGSQLGPIAISRQLWYLVLPYFTEKGLENFRPVANRYNIKIQNIGRATNPTSNLT